MPLSCACSCHGRIPAVLLAACDKRALTTCRFIVRDFEYDPKAIKVERDAKQRLEVELKKQFVSDFVTTVTVKSYSHSVYLHVICIFSL